MKNINYLLDDYMLEKDLNLNYKEYAQTEVNKLTKENITQLLTTTSSELPLTEIRYTLYDSSGQAFAWNITSEELNNKLPYFLTEELKPKSFIPLHMETVIDLIHLMEEEKHYKVYGYNQKLIDSWTLDHEQVSRSLLESNRDQLNQVDIVDLFTEDGDYLLDESGNIAMIKNTEHPFNMIHREMELYDIVDANGEIVFDKLEYETLGIVLSCLYFGMKEEAIQHLFLDFKSFDEFPISYSYMAYNRYTTSDRLHIKIKNDLFKLHRLVTNHKAEIDGHYVLYNEEETAFSEKIIRRSELFDLIEIFDGKRTSQLFSEELSRLWCQLIDIADSFNLSIYHMDRLKIGEWFMEQIEYKEGKVSDFIRLVRSLDGHDETGVNPIRTYFTLVNNETSEELVSEVNMYTLITKIISLNIKNGKKGNNMIKNEIETLGLGLHDSFALWDIPEGNIGELSDDERQLIFRDNYKNEYFPMDLLNEDLGEMLANTKYVLIGLNPGNEGVSDNGYFLNFHGKKKSMDYRLAAALYGTDMWGAFMTDLIHEVESDSSKINISEDDVRALENHLDELGISKEVCLVALGEKTYKILEKHSNRKVEKLPHYSSSNNGNWRAEKTRQIVMDIINK